MNDYLNGLIGVDIQMDFYDPKKTIKSWSLPKILDFCLLVSET